MLIGEKVVRVVLIWTRKKLFSSRASFSLCWPYNCLPLRILIQLLLFRSQSNIANTYKLFFIVFFSTFPSVTFYEKKNSLIKLSFLHHKLYTVNMIFTLGDFEGDFCNNVAFFRNQFFPATSCWQNKITKTKTYYYTCTLWHTLQINI